MCYPAQIRADWQKYTRMFGATLSLREFYKLSGNAGRNSRKTTPIGAGQAEVPGADKPKWKIVIPKVLEAAFAEPGTAEEREIKSLIDNHAAKK